MAKINELTPEFVEFIPDELQFGVLYVSDRYGSAVHLCPCGCGHEIVTPTGGSGWSIVVQNGGVTLNPSVGNYHIPCRTHYYVRENRVEWL